MPVPLSESAGTQKKKRSQKRQPGICPYNDTARILNRHTNILGQTRLCGTRPRPEHILLCGNRLHSVPGQSRLV
jgi:hypothetical protein